MVLTGAQITAFFQSPAQMGIPLRTANQLATEGITEPEDLVDFDKTTLAQVAENLRRPGGREPNPDPGAPPGSTIPTQPYVLSAQSQKRLLATANLVKYYQTVGRTVTAGNIMYQTVGRNFEQQWKSLEDRKEEDPPDVPRLSKALPPLKWKEAMDDWLARRVGHRAIPLSYVVREVAVPVGDPPALAPNLPHSETYGSVAAELVARATHAHPLFTDDNGDVYYVMEEGLRSTQYAASLNPFQQAKNGRAAYMAFVAQYCGVDKWESERKRQEEIMHQRIWKGQSNYTLEKFISQHRNANVVLTQVAANIPYELPNQRTRVTYLLDNINCPDPELQARIAAIRQDSDGMMVDFEAAVAYLLPADPVARKLKASNKRGAAQISDASGTLQKEQDSDKAEVAGASGKVARGSTGVEFRFYKKKEYEKLTKEQKDEFSNIIVRVNQRVVLHLPGT